MVCMVCGIYVTGVVEVDSVDMEVMILFFPLKIDYGSIERASGSCQGLDTSLIRVNSASFIYSLYYLCTPIVFISL
jgi:hypothetical protein